MLPRPTVYWHFTQWTLAVFLRTALHVVRKPQGQQGFALIPRRWVVERFLAWLTAHRRLARDNERDPAVPDSMIRWAAIYHMIRRLTRGTPATRTPRWRRPRTRSHNTRLKHGLGEPAGGPLVTAVGRVLPRADRLGPTVGRFINHRQGRTVSLRVTLRAHAQTSA
jgi:hypothetical protein